MRTLVLNALSGCSTLGCLSAGASVVGACDSNMFHQHNFPDIPVFSSKEEIRKIPHADLVMAMIQPNKICTIVPWVCIGLMPRQIVLCTRMRQWPKWLKGMDRWNWWFDTLLAKDYGLPIISKIKFAVAFRKDIKPTFSSFPFPEAPMIKKDLSSFLDPDPKPKLYVKKEGKSILPNDLWRLSHGKRIFLKDDKGCRKLSLSETKRIWGLKDSFFVGSEETIYKEPFPLLVADVVKEAMDWAWL